MDKDRQIRFLYPPLLLLAFLAFALRLDPKTDVNDFLPNLAPRTDALVSQSNILAAAQGLMLTTSNLVKQLPISSTPPLRNTTRPQLPPANVQLSNYMTTLVSNVTAISAQATNLATGVMEAKREQGIGLDKVVAIIAAGGAFVLVSGWVVGALALFVLRVVFFFLTLVHRTKGGPHEAFQPDDTVDKIWELCSLKAEQRPTTGRLKRAWAKWENSLFSAATLDHELLAKGVHDWLLRRWSSFTTSVNSCMALMLAVVLVRLMDIHVDRRWYCSLAILGLCLATHAYVSWRDTMGMVRYQAKRPKKVFEDLKRVEADDDEKQK